MKEICVVMDWNSRFAPGWSMVRQMDALGFGNLACSARVT